MREWQCDSDNDVGKQARAGGICPNISECSRPNTQPKTLEMKCLCLHLSISCSSKTLHLIIAQCSWIRNEELLKEHFDQSSLECASHLTSISRVRFYLAFGFYNEVRWPLSRQMRTLHTPATWLQLESVLVNRSTAFYWDLITKQTFFAKIYRHYEIIRREIRYSYPNRDDSWS